MVWRSVTCVFLLAVMITTTVHAQTDESEDDRRVRRLGDSLTVTPEDEWVPSFDVDQAAQQLVGHVQAAAEAMARGDLIAPAEANALFYLQQAQELDAEHPEVIAGREELVDRLVNAATENIGRSSFQGYVDAIEALAPDNAAIAQLQARQQAVVDLNAALAAADRLKADGALFEPAGANALEALAQLAADNPSNQAVQDGLGQVISEVLAQAREAAAAGNPERAEEIAAVIEALELPVNEGTRAAISEARQAQQLARAEQAMNAGDLATAQAIIEDMAAAGNPAPERITARLAELQWLQSHPPGTTFNDRLASGSAAPTMVVVPAGSFMMGSPPNEDSRTDREGPQLEIELANPFALSATEITNQQFAAFVEATGYQTSAERGERTSVYNANSGRMGREDGVTWRQNYRGEDNEASHPVIHVSFEDALAYARWLADSTGLPYRLPSEAEFEYALRAGSTTIYWWGSRSPNDPVENLAGERDESPTGLNWDGGFSRYGDGYWGTSPSGALARNPFGLYDMGGNVMEWTADCASENLVDKPVTGEAQATGNCDAHVVKGGSWASLPNRSRSAQRLAVPSAQPNAIVGFRVARDL